MRRELIAGMTLALLFSWMMVAEAQTASRPPMRKNQMPIANYLFSRPSLSPEARAEASAKAQQERERYKGITVKPHPQALGANLTAQSKLAALIASKDYIPEARRERFRWISDEMRTPITGWDATIVGTVPNDNGVLVKIKVSPKHEGDVGFHAPDEFLFESYLVSGNQIKYLGSEGPPRRGVVVFN